MTKLLSAISVAVSAVAAAAMISTGADAKCLVVGQTTRVQGTITMSSPS
jgi:hypothetical protein